MKNKIMTVVGSVICLSLLEHSSYALWGKSKEVPSERANADMGLGEYKGLKHAIGCKDFENQAGWRGQWELGDNLSIMLESALYDSGRFIVVDRKKLDDIKAEQDLMTDGRSAKSTKIAQTGVIRPAKYIATGAITEVELNESGGKGGIRIKGFTIGGGKKDAHIALIVKLIDTSTSEVVAKERIVGKPSSTFMNVAYSDSDFGADLGGFKKSPLGQAAQDAINQAAKFIAKQMEEFPFEGSVIKVSDTGQVLINRGSEFGMESGQELVMVTQGEQLIDPDSGAILGTEEGAVIGKLKVSKVAEKVSYADVVEGEAKPAPGTIVKAAE